MGSSEDDFSGEESLVQEYCEKSEGSELKDELLRRYSGYIGSLKHAFSKKKKGGKLPKVARQILLDWWTIHYKWPYPTVKDSFLLSSKASIINYMLCFLSILIMAYCFDFIFFKKVYWCLKFSMGTVG